jgi:stalled ribosome rescue protein Dom34
MSAFVIWIDREQAKLFEFSHEKMERRIVESKHTDHHTHVIDQLDIQRREDGFFSVVATHLVEASKILIIGPGVAKHHFRNYVGEHLPALAKKIVGCETSDRPTDPQIAAFARRFFDPAV